MEERVVYFETAGKENTDEVLKLVKERAQARVIAKIILASTRGDTARAAAAAFGESGLRLVVVPHQFGFGERQRFPQELVSELQRNGHRVHFGTMLFHTEDLYGVRTPRVMATLLRVFCQGIKVCVEIVLMACDGGLIEQGEKVIVVAGTGGGADTAVVATAAPSNKLANLHIHEIICKPL
ncbi:MAG: hypothetical protein IBX68_06070 [Dehalococcoidia bacterium]|nr:hypothetical protein [Dehalococcoidia bacterium]